MSDTNSAENFDDQLLSAYVDGELTGEELAQVERRLEADPAAQQLVAELRALSATLRQLPRATVGDNLREAVLQQTDARLAPIDGASSRRWIWASLAVAAALLLSVYLPTVRRDERDVAAVKPDNDGENRLAPRLEAPAEAVAESSEAAAMEAEALGRVAPAAQPSLRTAAPQPVLADAAESAVEDFVEDEEEPSLVVHLTLADDTTGGEQFDLLLANNRIALDDARHGSRDKRAKTKKLAGQAELVLVEAPLAQIGQVLQEVNVDTRNYQAIRLDAPDPAQPPVAQWRQWERSDLPEDKARGGVPINVGSDEIKSKDQSVAGDGRARARRVDAEWYGRRNQAIDELDANAQYRFGSSLGRKLAMKKQLKAAAVEAAGSLRVLFILHPPEPTSESAAAPTNQ